MSTQNIALIVEYLGSGYCGWQRQRHSPSVQETLEKCLSQVADHPVQVFCAGRTDTGVHATGQVVNFALKKPRPIKAWMKGVNNLLPSDICIRWAGEVSEEFHARHSALWRRYRYVIQNTVHPAAHLADRVYWFRPSLNEQAMHNAAQALLGEQDFSSFQAASCQSPTPMRNVQRVAVKRWQQFVVIDIQANAFLHHMVRNITGALIKVGVGEEDENFIASLLAKRDRTVAPATAQPQGLYLVEVGYPEPINLPKLPLGPLTLPDTW